MASLARADTTMIMAQTSWTGVHVANIPKRNPRTMSRATHTRLSRKTSIMILMGRTKGLHMATTYARKKSKDWLAGGLAGWLVGGITTREPVTRLAGWLAGGLAGWLAGWLAEEIYNQGGSRQISRTMYHHVHRVPTINPLETQGLPTSRITDDKGGSPQGRLYGLCGLYCHREVQP